MEKTYKKLMAATITMMAACAFFFIGCNKENPELDTPFVNVDQSIVNASATGGELTLTVTANRPWKLTDNMTDDKWLIADKTEGNGDAVITFTVAPNTGVTREADLRIATSTVYVDVRITQPGSIATEVIYAEDFGNEGTTANPHVSVADYQGYTKSGAGAANVTYSAEGGGASVRNNASSGTYTGASGNSNVMIASTAGGSFLINGIDPLGMTNMSLSFGANETSTTLTLFYNTGGDQWTQIPFEKTTTNWDLVAVTFAIPEGSTVLNLKFTAAITTYGTRIDDIKLVGSGGAPATGDLKLSPTSLSFAAAGELKSFTVTSVADWTASTTADWLILSQTSGSNGATVTVTATPNGNTTARNATITVTSGEETKTVAVTQAGAGSGANAIYYENVGTTTVTSNTNLSAFSGWSREGSGGNGVTYSGTNTTIRTSVQSTGMYDGASGGNEVHFGAAPSAFIVQNIALSNVDNVTLTFGASKVKYIAPNNVWDNFADNDLTLSYSSDGDQWYSVPWTLTSTPEPGSTVTNWALASAEIPTTGISSLSLKWDCTFASQIRIDDIKVVQSSAAPSNYLNLSSASASFTDAGGTKEVKVSSNTAWTVTPDDAATWCTVTPPLSGNDNGTFTVEVVANTDVQRTATITVKTNDNAVTKTFTVTQAAPAAPELSVNPSTLTFVVGGETKSFNITSNTAWTVKPDAAATWCTVTPPLLGNDNGMVEVTTNDNDTGAERTTTITITGTGVTGDKTVAITQAGTSGGGGTPFAKVEWDFVSAITTASTITSMDATTGSGTLTTTAGTVTGSFSTATNKSIWTGNWVEDGSVAKAWNMEIPVSGFTGGTLKVSFGAYCTATGPRDWAVEWSANGTDWSTATAAQTYTASTVTSSTYEKTIQPSGITDKLYIRLHVASEISVRAGTISGSTTYPADEKFAVGGNSRLMTKLTIEEEE